MKKSLVALAAIAAVSAASAQSSVTLYGVLDIGYGAQTTSTRDGSGFLRSRGVMDGANAGNRIGFRGTEDLGGGLKANFVIEQGISPTTGQLFGVRAASAGHQIDGLPSAPVATNLSGTSGAYSTSTNRQAYVGLASDGIGTFNIGWQYTALYELGTLSGYAVGSEGIPGADKAHLHGQYGLTNGTTIRANMIQYISPNFGGGFVARVQYGAGTGREDVSSSATGPNGLTTDKNRRFALMLQYANGPLSVAGAYTTNRSTQANVNGVLGAAGQTTNVYGYIVGAQPFVPGAPLSGVSRSSNLFQLGGSYDFGVAKLAGAYNRGKNGGLITSAAAGTSGFNYSYRAYQIGVSVPFGAIVPFIAYGRATTDSDNPAGIGATIAGPATNRIEDYRQAQIGVRYSLSKRSTAYAMYGQTINNAAALAGATSAYKDRKTIVGVQHSF